MYLAFYGLRELPFELTPNPKFLFMTPAHREALSNLQFGLSTGKPLTVLIGEAGTGKTTLLRAALESEACRHVRTVYISNPALKRDEFVQLLARNFELSAEAARSKAVMLGELEAALKDARARGETISLVVDEAQALSDELLEEIRLLANVETSSEKLLPLVLAGQPELADRLNESQLRQLKQRVALRCEIRPLDLSEAAAYVAARIRAAGGEPFRLFSREAITLIHQRSRGIPRTMSVICDNSLISGFAQGAQPVTREMVLEVCRDFDISGGNFGRESASAQSTDILAMAPDEDQTSDESAERSGLPGPSTTMQRRANSTAKANQGRRRFSLFGR
jgi:type II secretory pathway predicted ATPase ExeA